MTVALRRTFASLQVRNYRLYLFGQIVSLSGTWMQGVAQAWLVLKLTGSGTALGLVTALQFLPVLLLGPLGGVIADRVEKRKLLYVTQGLSGVLALVLGLLVATDTVQLWMVYVLASGWGALNAIDNPTRQTFVLEMVGPDNLGNAVTLNSVMVNLARVVGPAVAGILIATVGLAACFLLNAASYLAVLAALLAMRAAELTPAPRQPRKKGQLAEGFRYVRRTPELLSPLLMMAVIGTLAYEFQVVLPLMARFTFHGDAGTYAVMSSAMGGGAVVGGLITASRKQGSATALARSAIVFGIVILGVALAPTLWVAYLVLVLVGATSITFLARANTTLQLAAAPEMRGRVMSLWAVAFLGSTPIGGPIIGWIGEHLGPRWGLTVGGTATVLAGALAYSAMRRIEVRASDRFAAGEAEAEDALELRRDGASVVGGPEPGAAPEAPRTERPPVPA